MILKNINYLYLILLTFSIALFLCGAVLIFSSLPPYYFLIPVILLLCIGIAIILFYKNTSQKQQENREKCFQKSLSLLQNEISQYEDELTIISQMIINHIEKNKDMPNKNLNQDILKLLKKLDSNNDIKEKIKIIKELLLKSKIGIFDEEKIVMCNFCISKVFHSIPYLNRLLNSVIDRSEGATMVLLDSFEKVQNENDKASNMAKANMAELQGEDDNHNFEHLLTQSKEAIAKLQSIMHQIVRLNNSSSQSVTNLKIKTGEISKLLLRINDISDKSKVISFNLSIEAAKLGSKGKAFNVIVREIQKLNQQTNKLADEINIIVGSFDEYSNTLIDDGIKATSDIISLMQNSSKQSEEVLSALVNSYEMSSNISINLSNSTLEVNRLLSDVLNSLQFQDIIKQIIDNVISTLNEIKSFIQENNPKINNLKVNDGNGLIEIKDDILNRLIEKVKVLDEKEMLINMRK